MKERIKNTGEVVDAEETSHGIFRDTSGNAHIPKQVEVLSPLMSLSTGIDWEQRRYEIAKSMLSAVYKNDHEGADNMDVDEIVSDSILYADELIKQLKGGKA